MRSYAFRSFLGHDDIPEDVIQLFTETAEKGRSCKYASEIIYAGLSGRIDLSKPFNLPAYEKRIELNDTLNMSEKSKREMYITNDSASDDRSHEDNRGGIPEEKLSVKELKDAFDEVAESDELRYAISQIKAMNRDFIVVEELDLVEAIRLSLSGHVNAIKQVKRICDFYPRVAEYIQVILGCGKPFEEVYALA